MELCPRKELHSRENWYLTRYHPLLNVLKTAGRRSQLPVLSLLTRSKISLTLKGRKDSEETKKKKSMSRLGNLNPFYGKGPGIKALDLAAEKSGTKVYVYDMDTFTLVNGKPFRSLRMTANAMPVAEGTLPKKLDTGKQFKGYYYFTSPQLVPPK